MCAELVLIKGSVSDKLSGYFGHRKAPELPTCRSRSVGRIRGWNGHETIGLKFLPPASTLHGFSGAPGEFSDPSPACQPRTERSEDRAKSGPRRVGRLEWDYSLVALDSRLPVREHGDGDGIETPATRISTGVGQIGPSGSGQRPRLPAPDRLHGMAENAPAPKTDLEKNQPLSATGNKIDLSPADADVAIDDLMSGKPEICLCKILCNRASARAVGRVEVAHQWVGKRRTCQSSSQLRAGVI